MQKLLVVTIGILGVAVAFAAPKQLPRPRPVTAAAIRALDVNALNASAALRTTPLKGIRTQKLAVRAAEQRLNTALDAWAKSGTVKTCTTAAQRAAALAHVASFAGVYFRRLAGPLHTDVADLASSSQCAGDLTGDRLIGDYFDAIAKDDLAAATELLGKIEQQLQCMSALQVRAASLALRWALEYTRVTQTVKGRACNAGALDALDQAGLVVMYRAFERSLPYGMIALDWMRTRRMVFLDGLRDPNSVLSRLRLFVGERASSSTVVQLSAACRNDARGRLVTFVGASNEKTCDPLAALVRSFSDTRFGMGDCLGLDLEPMAPTKHGAIAELACRDSCSTLDGLSKQKGAPPSPFTGAIGTRVRTAGITPLGGRVSDVRSMCGAMPAPGGGGIGGASGRGVIGCIIDAQSANASGNFMTCVNRGVIGAKPNVGAVSGVNFRKCLTRQETPDAGNKPEDRTRTQSADEAAVIIIAKEIEREAIIRQKEAASRVDLTVRPEPSSGVPPEALSARQGPTDPNLIQQIGNAARSWPVIGGMVSGALLTDPADAARRHPDSTQAAEAARYNPPVPGERTITVGGSFLCSTEGGCAGGCTGWDVLTQAFQTCAEQTASRFHKPTNVGVRVRPSPDSAPNVSNPLLACVTPSSSPSLAQQLRGCLAINCPANQMTSVSSSDGQCRCGASTPITGGGTAGGSRSACSTVRCPMGTIPVATGARCVCQASGVPGPAPRPTGTLPGLGSSGPAPQIPTVPTPVR